MRPDSIVGEEPCADTWPNGLSQRRSIVSERVLSNATSAFRDGAGQVSTEANLKDFDRSSRVIASLKSGATVASIMSREAACEKSDRIC